MSRLELGRHGVQAGVIKTYEACGCTVERVQQSYRRGSRRHPGSAGMPDLYVWPPERLPFAPPWWHETKADEGTQRKAQRVFQSQCEVRNVRYVLGGVPEAIAQLQSVGITL